MPKKSLPKMNLKLLIGAELQALADAGTKEAIDKLKQIIRSAKDYTEETNVRLALAECEMLYFKYRPNNLKL